MNLKHTFADLCETSLPLKDMFKIYPAKGDDNGIQPSKEKLKTDLDELYKKRRQYSTFNLPTACWTRNTRESAVLWNHFAPKMGVCIHSTIDRFVDSLSVEDEDILGFDMQYCGYNASMNVTECMCSKQRYFQHEEEIRFYFISSKHQEPETEQRQHIKILVDVGKLIEKVTLSPDIPPLAAKWFCSLFKEKYGLNASKSSIEYR